MIELPYLNAQMVAGPLAAYDLASRDLHSATAALRSLDSSTTEAIWQVKHQIRELADAILAEHTRLRSLLEGPSLQSVSWKDASAFEIKSKETIDAGELLKDKQ